MKILHYFLLLSDVYAFDELLGKIKNVSYIIKFTINFSKCHLNEANNLILLKKLLFKKNKKDVSNKFQNFQVFVYDVTPDAER